MLHFEKHFYVPSAIFGDNGSGAGHTSKKRTVPSKTGRLVTSSIIHFNILLEASRGAGAQSVTVKPTGFGFDPEIKYLLAFIFSFLRSGVEAKAQR